MTAARIMVFGRAARAGEAKTRLAPYLGAEAAARLAHAMLADALATAAAARPSAVELWYAGDDGDGTLARLGQRHGAVLRRQPDGDLGHRMATALAAATDDGSAGLLMGSDCPLLTPAAVRAAMTALASHDAVMAPATDGGYVLLGAHGAPERLFADIAWGGSKVAAATRARFAELGWRWLELPARPDVDRPDDLAVLARHDPAWREWALAAGAGGATAATD